MSEVREKQALALVKARHSNAKNFSFYGTRDFLDGTLYEIRYDEDDEVDKYDYVYYDDLNFKGRPRIIDYMEDAINVVSDVTLIKKSGILDKIVVYSFRTGGISALLALIFSLTTCILVLMNRQTDPKLWEILLLVVGFYFGAKTSIPEKT